MSYKYAMMMNIFLVFLFNVLLFIKKIPCRNTGNLLVDDLV